MTVETKASTVLQRSLWKESPPLISPEQFPLKLRSSELFTKVFDALDISHFTYAIYDPYSDYHEYLVQNEHWASWSPDVNLELLSDKIFHSSKKELQLEDGEHFVISTLMAITSKLKINGQIKHLPMLDFDLKKIPQSIDTIKNMGLPPGLILETDKSYHYIGLTLMDQDKWVKWLTSIDMPSDDESETLMYDTANYISINLANGHTALRIKGYPEIPKQLTPFIVDRII